MTTTTYSLVPIPLWYFAQNDGLPLGGGYMKTFNNLDRTPKAIYVDSGGVNPWPNPVYFNANGEAPGMFFWADDVPYYVELYASDNTLVKTFVGFGPDIAGGGGGGTVTNVNFFENYVVNNNFTTHGYSSVVGGVDTFANIQNGTVIAPSNHHGLVYNGSTGSALIPAVGPDIMFVRASGSSPSTDTLSFSTADFAAGLVPLTSDVTPEYYIQLACSGAGNETLKAVQFPIDLHVKNLEQQPMTGMVWAKGNSGTQNLTMNLVQYFGTGSATTPVVTAIPITASPLAAGWNAYVANFNVPSVAGKTLGAGGDDAVYLQICFPTAALFNISFTKPKLYLGTLGSVFKELPSYDYNDRIMNSPRTGDIRPGFASSSYPGWILMNDTTIGADGSAAATANIVTWPLYSLLWNNVSDTYAPVSTGRGVSAYADFAALKTLTLTKTLGRALASAGAGSGLTSRALGENTGAETYTLATNNFPASNAVSISSHNFTYTPGGTTETAVGGGGSSNINMNVAGGGQAFSIIQPTTFMNVFIKL